MKKKLTGREKDLVVIAIQEALKDKLLLTMKEEFDAIIEKITYEETQFGNIIRRGFTFAGCDGSELDIYSTLRSHGYSEFYYDAPYNWGVVNLKEQKIYTYCEGDTALVECKNETKFVQELLSYYKFQLQNCPRSLDGDSVDTLRKAGLDVHWKDVKKARKEAEA